MSFIRYVGCRVNSVRISGKPGSPISVDVELLCREITLPSAADYVGTGSHASDPQVAPWRFEDGGIGWGDSAIDVTEISVSISRGLKPIYTAGGSKLRYLPPTKMRVTGELTVVWSGVERMQDLSTVTPRTLTWTLRQGEGVLTLSGVYLKRLDLPFTVDDVTFEKYSFTAVLATLT